jgi:hypothetical protein
MMRNRLKALVLTGSFAAALAVSSTADAGSQLYGGYICGLTIANSQVFMTIYTDPGCSGNFVGSGTMWAPGQPSGSVVNYWPSQSRYDRLTSDLINNRWSKMRINVDTGTGRNNAIASLIFDQN